MTWRFTSQTKSNGISGNCLKFLTRFCFLPKTTSSSKWSALILGQCYCSSSTRFYQMIFPQIVNVLPMPLLLVVYKIDTTVGTLSLDLNAITKWNFQWKMIFNTEFRKQGQEVRNCFFQLFYSIIFY